MGLPKLGEVARGDLIGPDSYMRLDRLRIILAHRTPLDLVTRDGSGAGTMIHWSHLLDSLILLLAAPLRPFMDAPHAVHWAAVALGPLSTASLGVALAWVLAPLVERGWRWTVPLLVALSPAVIGYGLAGVVHHHVLVALAIAMTAGWAGRAALGYGGSEAAWRLGAWAGASLWLSPETVPFTLLAYGALGLAWLVDPARRAPGEALRNSGSSFLLVTAAAFAVDPPEAGYGAPDLMRISLVYLLLAAAVAAVGWSLWGLDRWRLAPRRRGVLGIGIAFMAGGLWVAAFPRLLVGPTGVFGAAAASAYFGVITEMEPVVTARGFCTYLLDGAVATVIAAIIAWRVRSLWWGYGAFCGVLMLAVAQCHVRFATYPEAFAAAILPVLLTGCGAVFARYPERAQQLARIGVLAFFALSAGSAGLFAARPAPASAAAAPSCSLERIGTLLAPYGGEVVLADISLTPELLYRTRMLTVGSLYTNVAGFMRARAAWRSSPSDQVPEAVSATRASLLLFCPQRERWALLADLPPSTLFDRLNRDQVPPWLTKLGADPGSGFVLYRIDGSDEAAR